MEVQAGYTLTAGGSRGTGTPRGEQERGDRLRDPSFREEVTRAFTAFGSNLILQGIYQVYFARGVSMAGEGFAARITESEIMQFVIRKGFAAEVKSAFESALRF